MGFSDASFSGWLVAVALLLLLLLSHAFLFSSSEAGDARL